MKIPNLVVYLYRRPNMFKVQDNMYNLIGYGELQKLYTIEDYKAPEDTDLTLYYPERFLNIIELRCLIQRIESAGYREVTITCCSAFILQTVNSVNIRVVQDELMEEGAQFKQSNDESGMPYDGGLGVVMGSS